MATETGTICQRLMFPASPEIVFEMLTEPARLQEFSGMAAGTRPDGKMTAGNGFVVFKNVELERGKSIIQEWSTSDWPSDLPPSIIEFHLKAIGQGTDMAMVQTGVPLTLVDRYYEGWHLHYWNPLFEHLRLLTAKKR